MHFCDILPEPVSLAQLPLRCMHDYATPIVSPKRGAHLRLQRLAHAATRLVCVRTTTSRVCSGCEQVLLKQYMYTYKRQTVITDTHQQHIIAAQRPTHTPRRQSCHLRRLRPSACLPPLPTL
jgi:hypothetical protein